MRILYQFNKKYYINLAMNDMKSSLRLEILSCVGFLFMMRKINDNYYFAISINLYLLSKKQGFFF